MTSVRATLLGVFAQHKCDKIDSTILVDAFGEIAFEAVKALPGYAEEYGYASTAKRLIERYETQYPGQAGQQALMCLNMLKNLRGDDRFKSPTYEVARELTLQTLYPAWPQSDKDHFRARLSVIDEWDDFFISYTNRNAYTTNEFHQQLISQEFAAPVRPESELARCNFVARVIAKYLELNNLRGFVDFKSLQCGDDIEDKVLEKCRKTIAFIQLVEATSLVEPAPPTVNWCFREYQTFSAAAAPVTVPAEVGNRLFFVLAGGPTLPLPARLGAPYTDWRAVMARKLHIVLNDFARPFGDLQSKIGEVAGQIEDARKKIIESMLASWP